MHDRGSRTTDGTHGGATTHDAPPVSTFSIVARDPATGDLGIAVASKFLAVGAVVPWARAGVGAVATQAHANVAYGPEGLRLLATGLAAPDVLARLLADDTGADVRQCGLVDAQGRAAAHTGVDCMAWAGHEVGEGFACQGNILSGPEVVAALARTYQSNAGESFPARLLVALAAGEAAGGDRRGRQSAALYVVRERGGYGGGNDRWIDLRVDDHPTPIAELRRLLDLHRLYFRHGDTPGAIPLAGETRREVAAHLATLGYLATADAATAPPESLDAALAHFAGVENLEERLRADGQLDPTVLAFLRQKATRVGADAASDVDRPR